MARVKADMDDVKNVMVDNIEKVGAHPPRPARPPARPPPAGRRRATRAAAGRRRARPHLFPFSPRGAVAASPEGRGLWRVAGGGGTGVSVFGRATEAGRKGLGRGWG